MAHAHEFEQLDNGTAYCIRCPATVGEFNELSADPRIIEAPELKLKFELREPKPAERGSLPVEVKTEIENLRRLVQTIQDRLHALTRV